MSGENTMKRFKNFLIENINFPSDIFTGFELTQTQKTPRSMVQIRVSSDDRDGDRDEILRRLLNAGIVAQTRETASSVDPIYGTFEGQKFVINVKSGSGGMGESTLNSSITELFPCIAYEKKIVPTSIEDFMKRIMEQDIDLCNCVSTQDRDAAKDTVNKAESSTKYKEKMENALGILDYLYEQHKNKPIRMVYWGYRAKPPGVPDKHPGDMFIEYTDGELLGVSLKAGGKKTKEPQLNTYHRAVFVNSKGPSFEDRVGLEVLRNKTYNEVYSKLEEIPSIETFDGGKTGRHKDKQLTMRAINALSESEHNALYNEFLEIVRQALVDRFNKNTDESLEYIKKAILREAPSVPTIVIKAVGRNAGEVTDRNALGVFIPQVKFIRAEVARTKQNWNIILQSGDEELKLGMTVRSSSGGKLKQWSLKVTYNGIL
tara:strand:- start:1001 stop:2293 length:1293 start_codon:yes stop_codon:yes gene_type:complete